MKAIKPPKRPNPNGRQLPSRFARDFYQARRLIEEDTGSGKRIVDIQNHPTGTIITDIEGTPYRVTKGGVLER